MKNGQALFLDPEIVKMVRFLDPEIVKMDQDISGSSNQQNGAISGSRNIDKMVDRSFMLTIENKFMTC